MPLLDKNKMEIKKTISRKVLVGTRNLLLAGAIGYSAIWGLPKMYYDHVYSQISEHQNTRQVMNLDNKIESLDVEIADGLRYLPRYENMQEAKQLIESYTPKLIERAQLLKERRTLMNKKVYSDFERLNKAFGLGVFGIMFMPFPLLMFLGFREK
jgi:hypothetical protein